MLWENDWAVLLSLIRTHNYRFSFFPKLKDSRRVFALSVRVWFYSSDGFNIIGRRVPFSTTELPAIVFFHWLQLASLLVQAHPRPPHIENLKSTPCGQFYFNPRSSAPPRCLRPDQGFSCHCYSKDRLNLVITVVSGVVLARMLRPKIIYSPANWTANRRL